MRGVSSQAGAQLVYCVKPLLLAFDEHKLLHIQPSPANSFMQPIVSPHYIISLLVLTLIHAVIPDRNPLSCT